MNTSLRSLLAAAIAVATLTGATYAQQTTVRTSTITWDDEVTTGDGALTTTTTRTTTTTTGVATDPTAPARQPTISPSRDRTGPAMGPQGSSYANQWGIGGQPMAAQPGAVAVPPAAYDDVDLVSEPSEVQRAPASGATVVPRGSTFEWTGGSRVYQISPDEPGRDVRGRVDDDPFRPYVDVDPSNEEEARRDTRRRWTDDSFQPYVDAD